MWKFNKNTDIFIQENIFELLSADWCPFLCLGLNVLNKEHTSINQKSASSDSFIIWGPFYQPGITTIHACISKHMQ